MNRSAILLAVMLATGSLAACASSPGAAAPECNFATGGVLRINPEVAAAYAVETSNGAPLLRAMAVVRYDAPVRSTSLPEWPSPPIPRGVAGGSIDTLVVAHDDAGNRMWIHTRPVDLGTSNVLLIDRNASGDGVPRVVTALRVESRLDAPPVPCDGGAPGFGRALRKMIEETPVIRDFVQTGG